MKFRDWFSIKGVRSEMKHVSWLTKGNLLKNSMTVLTFCFVMGLFFYASDMIVATILKALGMN